MAANTDEAVIKHISAKEFSELDFSTVTVLDLREPDEVLIHPIEGAINVPFSQISTGLKEVPQDKTVYVICRTGDFSEEVAEILADRGYDAVNVDGGYDAYREYASESAVAVDSFATAGAAVQADEAAKAADPVTENTDSVYIDARALRCPGPIVKVADTLRDMPTGSSVYVEATEDAFASDIAVWCERTGNSLDRLDTADGLIKAYITKKAQAGSVPESNGQAAGGNDKTFVVFSGDLDKTIAAFIIANGAASLGRNVTMFFTFWGLNILRQAKKVRVRKNFIEKCFGFMLPRGTTKLGLSRMNMLGAGPKMIRMIMKKKGISSLEQLISDAREHGVRIVACQMSMDIMGIHKEELIDGVELGGVATFIGSGEKSDMSLFI